MNIKSLTIYCSSSNNLDPIYYEKSKQMIHVMGKFDYSIVYGGGQVGIMGVIAKTSINKGGMDYYVYYDMDAHNHRCASGSWKVRSA